MFPAWRWNWHACLFGWKPKIPRHVSQPVKWTGSLREWQAICCFLRGLRWQESLDSVTSLCELTVLFHQQGRCLDGDPQPATYFEYRKKIRCAVNLLATCDEAQVFAGAFSTTLAKAAGRTMPYRVNHWCPSVRAATPAPFLK
ncbi:unnamed protein product [Durusdinium trenchii]|uniref:Integrase SAM-like N-terminal domain-containing protein n=1 Tax=Durusdinium trenchii TaxID=1381693 RepID=A0ABP0NZF5_9DINO